MKRKEWAIIVASLALIASVAGLLHFVQGGRKLGEPGVRLSRLPLMNEEGKVVATNSIYMPPPGQGWSTSHFPVTDMERNWLPKDTTFGRQLYLGPNQFQVAVSAVLMGTDRTSIHKPQYCLSGQGWSIIKTEVASIPMAKPHPYDLRVMKLTTAKDVLSEGREVRVHGIYVYWFVADGQLTPYHGERMWWMARDLITKGTLQRWAYITYFTTCYPGQEDETFARLSGFIQETTPEFQLAAGPRLTATAEAPSSIHNAEGSVVRLLASPDSVASAGSFR